MAADPLAPFADDPAGSAILLDVDGTLAPIVPHPSRSEVPIDTLATMQQLLDRFSLVGCVSGRSATEVARLVPLAGLAIAGNHGLEIVDDGELCWAPGVEPWLTTMADVSRDLEAIAKAADAWVEAKGPTLSVHFREARDPDAARMTLAGHAVPVLTAAGLDWRWGRMTLEARPPVPGDKGTAVRLLLDRHPGIVRSVYAGDDVTDLDAFREVDVRIAVRSDESPAELLASADLTVDGPAGLAAMLSGLVVD